MFDLYNLKHGSRLLQHCIDSNQEKEPEILEALLVEWEKYFTETGMYDPGAEARKSKW